MKNNFQKYLQVINELKIPKIGLKTYKDLIKSIPDIIKLDTKFYLAEYPLSNGYAFATLTLKRPNRRHTLVQTVRLSSILTTETLNAMSGIAGLTSKGAKKYNINNNNISAEIVGDPRNDEERKLHNDIRKILKLGAISPDKREIQYTSIADLTQDKKRELRDEVDSRYREEILQKSQEAQEASEDIYKEMSRLDMEIWEIGPSEVSRKNKLIDKAMKKGDEAAVKHLKAKKIILQDKLDDFGRQIEEIWKDYKELKKIHDDKMDDINDRIKAFTSDREDVETLYKISIRKGFMLSPDWDGRTKEQYHVDITLGGGSFLGEVYMTEDVYEKLLAQLNKKANNLN
jgi:hypothetical protein